MADSGSERLLALLGDSGGGLEVVRRICGLCVTELAVSGAGVSVMGGPLTEGSQVLLHATDDAGVKLEDLQLTVGEGPSVDAYNSGGPVIVPDLELEHRRWPVFVPGAAGFGVAAVCSFPLQVGAARFGVLNLHRTTSGPMTGQQLSGAFTLAEAATVALLDDVEAPGSTRLRGQGDVHNAVHQATGILTIQLGVSVQDALLRIRAHAYTHQLTLNEVGRQIVGHELHLQTEE
ncbi:GAF and ANTAR domain-containing protein [Amycolatopsis sp. DG1A-15b]|uniref:GAF and ANTAR domain-containing protein n=1 Tax=Amycolatopsis sp. DG1A-15b TaxID=3052846 RepID=UPI00255B4140|nr:GAF and ANTAR domain-containing protein [Amycolatopsis sp. DG1A-15b]WIX87144.1 GAF and ANTAR domain-containing protein [Amycolatopsis sp. DG1A-15b]